MNRTPNRRARGRAPSLLVAATVVVGGLVIDGLGLVFDGPAPPGGAQEPTLVAEGHQARAPTDDELTPSVKAAFRGESYAPGETARLVVSSRVRGLTLQLFRVGAERLPTVGNVTMGGPASPRGIEVVAEIPDLLGPGSTAQMTYYETPSGAKVFAAGAFTLAGRVWDPVVARVVANLWRELSKPDHETVSAR